MAESFDIVVVGAGAAGLATAIFAAREAPDAAVAVVDGARTLGAKILVSGGGRCNVTNRRVNERDFSGGSPAVVRRVLAGFPADDTVTFFKALGVGLHEEEHGKLFPDSQRARTIVDALVNECRARGVRIRPAHRVTAIARRGDGFEVGVGPSSLSAGLVALATGGLSLPKTGSDGAGYGFAQALGHSLVPTTPALVPLTLEGTFHKRLAGVSSDVDLALHVEGSKPRHVQGSLLWTHFGISGPAALDLSRHWLRARLEQRRVSASASLMAPLGFEATNQWLIDVSRKRPRLRVAGSLALRMPARLGAELAAFAGLGPDEVLSQVPRERRKTLVHALTTLPLPVSASRGYTAAEATAGGIALSEIDPATMRSRVCPGLFLVGEMLDVDGRLGGFNFQWAWSSARVGGAGLAAAHRAGRRVRG